MKLNLVESYDQMFHYFFSSLSNLSNLKNIKFIFFKLALNQFKTWKKTLSFVNSKDQSSKFSYSFICYLIPSKIQA